MHSFIEKKEQRNAAQWYLVTASGFKPETF